MMEFDTAEETHVRGTSERTRNVTYLWASSFVSIDPSTRGLTSGPTALARLTEEAASHLHHAERYTLYLHRSGRMNTSGKVGAFRRRAEAEADLLATALRQRHPVLRFTCRATPVGRNCVGLQFIPDTEWHPERRQRRVEPRTAQCDASWSDTLNARAGITFVRTEKARGRRTTASINLTPAGVTRSTEAEFLGVCLAMLTKDSDGAELIVRSDEESAVEYARLLRDGLMPPWVHQNNNSLTLQIVVAAMTSARMRRIRIQQLPRERLTKAHEAAAYDRVTHSLLHPRTWARRQGIALGRQDLQLVTQDKQES